MSSAPTFADGLPLRHAWGGRDVDPSTFVGARVLRSFPHPRYGARFPVALVRTLDGARYVTGPRRSYRYEDGHPRGSYGGPARGRLVRDVLRLDFGPGSRGEGEAWGRAESVRCHRPGHPWDVPTAPPGHHLCGLCGFPTWVEVHGYATGSCERCGYAG